MKDYKNVKVPRRYRSTSNRTVVRRVEAATGPKKRGGSVTGQLGSVLTVLLTAALCYGGWEGYRWLTHAEIFSIAGVDVKGVRSMSDENIRDVAAMFTGQNVFQVDPGAATRRVMADPWVRDVRIERRLPNRISIFVAERVPKAVLHASNGKYLIDGEGVVMVPIGAAAAPPLPVIALRDCRAVPREPVTKGAVLEALELLDELAARGGWDIAGVTVKADSAETVTIVYADHEFRIGSGNYNEKLRRMGEIVADMRQRGLAYTYVELRPERQAAVMVVKNTKLRR
ncbi:MAG: FtsQ-type POTRA domain-containing protein [Nitrospirota bacterium]